MGSILENICKIRQEIDTTKVDIIAVTKYVGIQEIIETYKTGIRNFAENKVQDAEQKKQKLPESIEKDIIWHFAGHLQTNKVKKAVGNFEYIHSIDSQKIAKCVSQEAKAKGINQKILLEINIAKEETKFGFRVEEIKEDFGEIISLDSLYVVAFL